MYRLQNPGNLVMGMRGIHFQNAFSNAFQLFVNQSFAWASSGCGEWGLLFVAVHGLLFVVASRQSPGSRRSDFRSCGPLAQQLQFMGSRAADSELCHMGLVAPQHVESSWCRDQTQVPCIGRQIFIHCVTREVWHWHF